MEWSKKDLIRFWSKINKTDGCWEWNKPTHQGYGRLLIKDKLILAHRLSWSVHNGSIPDGLCVLHRCDNRKCVRPDHLFLGTVNDNNQDRQTKGRSSGGRNGGGLVGERNGRAKLSEKQVRQIKQKLLSQSGASIAREYGVKKETIYAIKARRIWSYVV